MFTLHTPRKAVDAERDVTIEYVKRNYFKYTNKGKELRFFTIISPGENDEGKYFFHIPLPLNWEKPSKDQISEHEVNLIKNDLSEAALLMGGKPTFVEGPDESLGLQTTTNPNRE